MSGENISGIGSKVNSPCVSICNGPLTDSKEGVCTGCYRTIAECEEWPRSSDWRRLQILDNCAKRKQNEMIELADWTEALMAEYVEEGIQDEKVHKN